MGGCPPATTLRLSLEIRGALKPPEVAERLKGAARTRTSVDGGGAPRQDAGVGSTPRPMESDTRMDGKLGIGATFPHLTLDLVDGGTLDLPGGMSAKYRIVLFYRGHW